MIVTELFNGQGLGNQLANYVATRVLAKDKGYKFGIMHSERFKGFEFMDIDTGELVIGGLTLTEGHRPQELPNGIEHYYHETTSDYDPEFNNIKDNTYIHGNLQGVEYFKHRISSVREWLKVEPMFMPDDLCVINFRGGEYVGVEDFFLPQSYWDNAIMHMLMTRPNMQFEVHTDDPVTARKFFPTYPIISDIEINWRSIRYAKFLILSNSSFAIIPAYLNEDVRRIIAPRYFARHNKGYWFLEQNWVKGWEWLDKDGQLYEK